MIFKNYLTTPSGKYCTIQEISNRDYLIILKYLQGEDYKNFFECITEMAKRDIPDFDNFDIVEKCYIWIAMCMYSIRPTIEVTNKMLGNQEVTIGQILNNIESQYVPVRNIEYNIGKNYVLSFGYPTSFSIDGELPIIDFYSGLKKINGEDVTQEQKDILKTKLPTKHISFIEQTLRQGFENEIDLLHEVPMNSMKINSFSEALLANVISFYKMPLDVFYHVTYAAIRHLRMSYSDFMKISHVEASILLKCVIEENRKEQEEANGDNTSVNKLIQNHYD